MGPLDPKFTASFEVLKDKYAEFIMDGVRGKVTCTKLPDIKPRMLLQEKEPPTEWFHIILKNGRSSLTLAIRMDNLYLVGFQTASGVWWEFNNEKKKNLIPGARWLGFSGSYPQLIGGKLTEVSLGRRDMISAVDALGKYTGEEILDEQSQGGEDDPYDVPKKMLARLVIMLCEGLRFLNVSARVDQGFKKLEATRISNLEAIHVNCWVNISKAVVTNDFSHLKEETKIKNRVDAEKVIALLKNPGKRTPDEEDYDLSSRSTGAVCTLLA